MRISREIVILLISTCVLVLALIVAKDSDGLTRIRLPVETLEETITSGSLILPRIKAPSSTVIFLTDSNLVITGRDLQIAARKNVAAIQFASSVRNAGDFARALNSVIKWTRAQDWSNGSYAIVTSGKNFGAVVNFGLNFPQHAPDVIVSIGSEIEGDVPKNVSFPIHLIHGGINLRSSTDAVSRYAADLRSANPRSGLHALSSANGLERYRPAVLALAIDVCSSFLRVPAYSKLFSISLSEDDALLFDKSIERAGGNKSALLEGIQSLSKEYQVFAMQQVSAMSDHDLVNATSEMLWASGRQEPRSGHRTGYMIVALLTGAFFIRPILMGVEHKLLAREKPIVLLRQMRIFVYYAGLFLCVAGVLLIWKEAEALRLYISFSSRIARYLNFNSQVDQNLNYLIKNGDFKEAHLGILFEHAEIAHMQRSHFYLKLPDELFSEYVLLPQIAPDPIDEQQWRKALWTYLYPRVRKSHDPHSGAESVFVALRELVQVDPELRHIPGVNTIWKQKKVNAAGFHKLYVAGLRAVGIAARVDRFGNAELYAGDGWIPAPVPILLVPPQI